MASSSSKPVIVTDLMGSVFGGWMSGKRIDVLSVHIPKTAGSSFLRALQTVYGRSLLTLYRGRNYERLTRGLSARTMPWTRALHGHFQANKKLIETYPDARLIAWVRDPVERIISYYFFWKHLKPEGNPNHDRFLESGMSIAEFARTDYMRNEMSSYFGDCDLDDFFFVGFVDRYAEDLDRLCSLMNWPHIGARRENVGAAKKPVSDAELRELQDALAEEISFYQRLRDWRTKRDAKQP